MKTIYILLGMCLCFTSISAQPVINPGDLQPIAGQNYTMDSVPYFDVSTLTGPNQYWNFAELANLGGSTFLVMDASETLFADSFPQSDYAITQPGFASYYNVDSAYEFDGDASGSGDSARVERFSDPQTYLTFPATYNTSGTDTYAAVTYHPDGLQLVSGTTSFEVTGYGTLVLPGGTYNDVLMLKVVGSEDQTYNSGDFTMHTTVNDTNYAFLKAGYFQPLMTMSTERAQPDDGPASSSKDGRILSAVTGIDRPSPLENNTKAYPNPSPGNVSVQITLDHPRIISFNLLDANGKLLFKLADKKFNAGVQALHIQKDKFPHSGVYLLEMITGNTSHTLKLVVDK